MPELAEWCWDYGEATGDARYCSLWRALNLINELFEPHRGISPDLVSQLDLVLRRGLPEILDAETAESASQFARGLREELFRALA